MTEKKQDQNRITRRDFIKKAGKGMAAAALPQ
ncbi:MAG: twin-arginine translocation signal domain-containing protein [Deltaproteobacteria bacterium]|nr:twin-arginine translocation signal domain-containing protein [Deltaproteobacteria bacterium]